jgi:hypothetical protein
MIQLVFFSMGWVRMRARGNVHELIHATDGVTPRKQRVSIQLSKESALVAFIVDRPCIRRSCRGTQLVAGEQAGLRSLLRAAEESANRIKTKR